MAKLSLPGKTLHKGGTSLDAAEMEGKDVAQVVDTLRTKAAKADVGIRSGKDEFSKPLAKV